MAHQPIWKKDDAGKGMGQGACSGGQRWRLGRNWRAVGLAALGACLVFAALLRVSQIAVGAPQRAAQASDGSGVFLPIALSRLTGRPSDTPTVAPTGTVADMPTPTTDETATVGPSPTATPTLSGSETPGPTSTWTKTPGATMTASPTGMATPILSATPTLTPSNTPTATPTLNPVQQRFGVNYLMAYGTLMEYPLERLPFGWHSDYYFRIWPQESLGREYVQIVPVDSRWYSLSWSTIRTAAQYNPGSLWLIGNEPECSYQANLTPDAYAQRYYKAYSEIKAADPSARVAIGGVVQPTPLRLQWLDMVRGRYQSRYGAPIPVDVWNIHNMILDERAGGSGAGIPVGIEAQAGKYYPKEQQTNINYFKAHIVAMRTWMKERGYRDKPLIISEYGVLESCAFWEGYAPPSCVDRINGYMDATFEYMLNATDDEIGYPADGNRLVQRWSWFSLNMPTYEQLPGQGMNGQLCDPYSNPKQLTAFGEHFESTVNRLMGIGGAVQEP